MPNRIIKESICTSDNLNNLSLEEEVFFYRLLVHCDDYGLMDARPAILRAKCFPLKVDKIKLSQIEKWLHSLVKNQLIALYEYDGRPYLKMLSWEEHQQIRSRKAKYPLPPEDIPCKREHILPEEKDIEDLLYDVMSSTKRFEEHTLLSVERQVRVGESYLDIVAKTESSETLVFELKRGRLSNKAIDQISKYLTLINGNGILIGCGLSANFDIERCRSNDIAVVIYDDDLNMSLVLGNSAVNSIDLTLNHVKSRYAKLAPNPIQSNPIQSESNPNTNPNPNTKDSVVVPDEILSEWNAYVDMRKKIKKPMTDKAALLALKKLNELAPDDYEKQKAILNQSVFNSWQGLFPLKGGYDEKTNRNDSGTVSGTSKSNFDNVV